MPMPFLVSCHISLRRIILTYAPAVSEAVPPGHHPPRVNPRLRPEVPNAGSAENTVTGETNASSTSPPSPLVLGHHVPAPLAPPTLTSAGPFVFTPIVVPAHMTAISALNATPTSVT